MSLKITHRNAADVPAPNAMGRVNEDATALKVEMQKLAPGMVLEIQANDLKAVRSAKRLVTSNAKELGVQWQHWNVGATVYAKPAAERRRRAGRPKKSD